MIAPDYPPAAAYEAPVAVPCVLSLDRVSVATLMADDKAWAIVTRHMPALEFIAGAPGVAVLLDNMTVVDFGVFGPKPTAEALASANAELAMLPARVTWP